MEGSTTARLNRATILSTLQTERFGRSLEILESCTSTNDVAAKFALQGVPEGFTVLADEQTSGRGQRRRAWVSPRGGIWMTVVLRPRHVADDLSLLQIIGGLAVARAIRSTLDIQAYVRWPNDVLANGLKLAGALVETQFKGDLIEFALLGLGVNANFHTDQLGKDIKELSTSLMDLCGSPMDRVLLVTSILKEIEQQYDLLCAGEVTEILAALRRVECSIGRRVVVKPDGAVFTGIFEDYVSPTKVRVRRDDGSHATIEASSVVSVKYVRVRSRRKRLLPSPP